MAIVNPSGLPVDNAADLFDFVCEVPRCGWASFGWEAEAQAVARGDEHQNEHDTGELMTELTVFETQVGFVRATEEN